MWYALVIRALVVKRWRYLLFWTAFFCIVFLRAALCVTGTYSDSYMYSYLLADQALSFVFRKYLHLVSTHVAYETREVFSCDVITKFGTHPRFAYQKPGFWYFPPYFYVRCLYGPPWSSPNKPAVGERGPWFINIWASLPRYKFKT